MAFGGVMVLRTGVLGRGCQRCKTSGRYWFGGVGVGVRVGVRVGVDVLVTVGVWEGVGVRVGVGVGGAMPDTS